MKTLNKLHCPNFFFSLNLVWLIWLGCGISGLSAQENSSTPESVAVEILGPEIISSPLNDRDFTIAPDGQTAYFTRSSFNHRLRSIIRIDRVGEVWANPQVAAFSGEFNDLEPFFAPDGKRLYFASNRSPDQETQKRDFDIWYVERSEGKSDWSNPIRLDSTVNTSGNEFYPAVTDNYNLYFTAERDNGVGTEDIFLSRYENGVYGMPEPLSIAVNSKTYEFNAYVNPTEDLIIFSSSDRDDDLGGGDLYYAVKQGGIWAPARHFEEGINSASLDYCPYYDPSTQTLYFTSNRSVPRTGKLSIPFFDSLVRSIYNGYGNLYFTEWQPD